MKKLFLVILTFFCSASLIAQEVRYRFSDDGKYYLKFTLLNQTWIKWSENNDGSLLNGTPVPQSFDIGLRRTRFQLFGPVMPKVFFYTQFGMNNFGFTSARKAGAFFHDVLCEYEIVPKYISAGGGLTAWTGMSRFSSPAVASFLGVDAPLFAQSNNDVDDQFLRTLSMYAKGKIGKLDYRVVVSKPMTVQTASAVPPPLALDMATFNPKPANLAVHGYFMYQFLDQESNATPYTAGTYLGEKRIFNLGVGAKYQRDAMSTLINGILGQSVFTSDMFLFAADAFYDAPLSKARNSAISVYGGYFNYSFGRNYLRSLAPLSAANALSPNADGSVVLNGPGNGYLAMGTGSIYYLQAGFLVPKKEATGIRWMPYAAGTLQDFHRIGRMTSIADAGVTMLLHGHKAKITLGWQNREQITAHIDRSFTSKRKNTVILQLQIGI